MAKPIPFSLFQLHLLYSLTISMSCTETGFMKPSIPLVTFLERLQETAVNTFGISNVDPKTYVDLSLRFTLSETEEAFDELPRTSHGSVQAHALHGFIEKYFDGADEDMVRCEAEDYVEEPEGFLSKVEHPEVRAWALKVHSLWKTLSRRVSSGVKSTPHLHTLLPLPAPFIIPGARYREVYYWDSYWIIRGLLVSKMYKTAKGMVINLISLLEEYGFVPNGARAYYTNRSQLPLLSAMIYEIYNATDDIELVKRSLPALRKEYEFWNSEIHRVTIKDPQGCTHTLNRYNAMWNKPRPEGSVMDKGYASKFLDVSEKQQFYHEVATICESGWDFSTRWLKDPLEFTSVAATSVIPVDLNAVILGMELNIAFFAKVTGDNRTAQHFLQLSESRKKAINSVFWNSDMKQWLDYWLTNSTCQGVQVWEDQQQNHNVFGSNFVPLWMEPFYSDSSIVDSVVESLKTCGLVRVAGIAASLTNSGQQWDFPNGWPMIQHMIVEGLMKSGLKEAASLGEEIARRWITTNYIAYKKTGFMHEKYDVDHCGDFGGGGEYVPQTGFGWSNQGFKTRAGRRAGKLSGSWLKRLKRLDRSVEPVTCQFLAGSKAGQKRFNPGQPRVNSGRPGSTPGRTGSHSKTARSRGSGRFSHRPTVRPVGPSGSVRLLKAWVEWSCTCFFRGVWMASISQYQLRKDLKH